MAKLIYRLTKGFLYGAVCGLFFSVATYLLASAVLGIGVVIGLTPAQLSGIIFGACLVGGIGMEYADWMDEKKE
ncbi:MAG: hypothetical protein QXR62_05730 [Candidatus Bathyarchaeia archaeon]